MIDEKIEIKCPACESTNYKKNGKRKGIQRYYCKNCNKAFSLPKNKIKYEPHERAVLSFLLNILENNFYGKLDLKEALKPNKNYHNRIKEIVFDTRHLKKSDDKEIHIQCFQPKLLICQDNNFINFIQIPPAKFREKCSNVNEKCRNIMLHDNECYVSKNIENKNIVPYKNSVVYHF